MKIHRFIGTYDLSKKEVEVTNPENIRQMKDVLKLKKGEKIILSNGMGLSAEAVIISISDEKIICVLEKMENKTGNNKKVNLYLAILKKENFELAVQKATEVGVFSITPLITQRTIKLGLNIERLKKIILEASEQCERSIVPILFPILNFENALAYASASEEKIIFHTAEKNNLYAPNIKSKNISIFVGPEGGFTEKEISVAENSGYTVTSLGSSTLRSETAAIVATYRTVHGI